MNDSNYFAPASVDIAAGGTVTWVWSTATYHDVTGSFGSSGLRNSGAYSVTFSTPGQYAYECEAHPRMSGVVAVH